MVVQCAGTRTVQRVDPEMFVQEFGSKCIDLVSAAFGGSIHSFSDEFFAAASNLLTVTPPVWNPGYFVETGAWFDGWETRRHNPNPRDWVIVKLGVPSGQVWAVEVDTAYFNGNHAPAVTVEAAYLNHDEVLAKDGSNTSWDEILPLQECGASQRHIWVLPSPTAKNYSHVRLSQYPDGGIARFRLYGTVVPVFPTDPEAIIDLAAMSSGGIVISYSDSHFGAASNLLLPGRGTNMGDGWETKRSREPNHVDWAIVRLGAPAKIEEIIVDTLHFRGNFPREVKVEGIDWKGGSKEDPEAGDAWTEIVLPAKCAADKEHAFSSTKLVNVQSGEVYTHVKMTIVPDGGVKRLRVFGKRAL
ncbi:Allantoicase [Kalaharituber pfeilii]|nr:Allantoicase [Kalaharituber pfeilii]